jgi:hypothetical protein
VTTAAWRKPTAYERSLIAALCSFPHPGYDVYAKQIDYLEVREFDRELQLECRVDDGAPIVVDPIARRGMIGEAHYVDDDGIGVDFLLHVDEGKLDFLEIFKVQNSDVLRPALNRQPLLSLLKFSDPRAEV